MITVHHEMAVSSSSIICGRVFSIAPCRLFGYDGAFRCFAPDGVVGIIHCRSYIYKMLGLFI